MLVIYKGDAGYVSLEDRATLDQYLRRGGGIVSLHDALCADDTGVLREHRRRREEARRDELHARGERALHDRRHGAPDHAGHVGLQDHRRGVLPHDLVEDAGDPRAGDRGDRRNAERAAPHKGEVVPQIWTYEKSLAPAPTGSPYRAFVWMQGHNYSNFALPQVQPMMLRAIAWAGKRPVDTLMTERPAARRPRHGTGR